MTITFKKEGQAVADEISFREKIKKSVQFAMTVIVLINWYNKAKRITHHILVNEGVSKDPSRCYLILRRFESEGLLKKEGKGWRIYAGVESYKDVAKERLKLEGYDVNE